MTIAEVKTIYLQVAKAGMPPLGRLYEGHKHLPEEDTLLALSIIHDDIIVEYTELTLVTKQEEDVTMLIRTEETVAQLKTDIFHSQMVPV
mmetsp:Transcript_24596/g.38201  ORF Transcript_24596/g.38201 Transcript_24596/m.38201 type:complete len:90 (-) Transcript_24596:4621-4890(-)